MKEVLQQDAKPLGRQDTKTLGRHSGLPLFYGFTLKEMVESQELVDERFLELVRSEQDKQDKQDKQDEQDK